MDKTKYVEDWTAKYLHNPSPDLTSLSRRKLLAAPGTSSPESTSEGIEGSYENSKDLYTNSDFYFKCKTQPFDRSRNLSIPKRNTNGLVQISVNNEQSMKQNAKDTKIKRN